MDALVEGLHGRELRENLAEHLSRVAARTSLLVT